MSIDKQIKGMGKVLQLLSPLSIVKNIPYIVLIFILTVIYISNSNKAISLVREHSRKLNELKEERWRYRDLQSRLMYQTSERMIIEKSSSIGLQPLDRPAFEIVK
jgi:hypothetical protein